MDPRTKSHRREGTRAIVPRDGPPPAFLRVKGKVSSHSNPLTLCTPLLFTLTHAPTVPTEKKQAGQYADANAKYGQVLVALNRVFPWTQETDGGGGGGGVGGETISASGERKKVKTLTATVLSNRALTCRRLGQHASALEDACKADCLLAELGLEAELGLRIKTKYAMGESLAHLGRPVEACDVLRQALRLVETMKKEQDEEKNEQTSCDVAGLVSCLRRAARSLPMSYVASHWADAICSGESVSFLSPNPREGNLLKPIRPAAMRATKAEIARRLLVSISSFTTFRLPDCPYETDIYFYNLRTRRWETKTGGANARWMLGFLEPELLLLVWANSHRAARMNRW
jgi:hypothetical protein|tara:strand:+ start:577 stop:1608 length:1032 start_codon:yes stop_codon:yes gene_type:complete